MKYENKHEEVENTKKASNLLNKLIRKIISILKKHIIDERDDSDSMRQSLFIGLAFLSIFACGLLLLYGSYMFIINDMNTIAYIEIFSYLLLVFIVFFKRINMGSRSLYIVSILYAFSIVLLITTGFEGAGLVAVIAIMVLAGIVLDRKRLARFAITNILVFIFITYLLLSVRLNGFKIAAYKDLWFINMLTTQVSGIGLLYLVHIIYDVLKKQNKDLRMSNELLQMSREKEKLYADIYRSSPIAVGIAYPNGDLGECNQQCAILAGFTMEEISALKWNSEIVTPVSWIKKEISKLSVLNPYNDVITYEKESITKNGDTIPIELTVKAKFKEDKSLDYYICFIHDISERKKAEERLYKLNFELERLVDDRTKELKKTSNRLELAAKAGKIGVWEWYGDDEVVKWDSQMYSLYNFEEENLNLSFLLWFNMIHPNDRKPTYKKLKKALNESDEFLAEFRIIWKDGSTHYIKSLATIYRNSKGIPMRIVGVNWDVTEENELNKRIKKESDRLQNLLDDSPIAVVISTDGVVEYQNKLFASKFGLSNGVRVFNSYVDIKDRENAIKQLEESDSLLNYKLKAYDKDGNILELIMNYFKIVYKGKPSLLVWIVDVTSMIKMEEQLSATKNAAESVIDYSPLPLLIIDSESFEVLRTNKAFLDYNEIENVYKVNPNEIVVNPELTLQKIVNLFRRDGIVQNEEIEIKRIGTNITSWVMFSMYTINYQGRNSLAITFMDISEKNEYQIQLAKAKEKALNAAEIAEEATRAKGDFLANMSHEIRTPINAVIGLNDLMYNTTLSDKQLDYTNKIAGSSNILLKLINDILDFSKMEAGKLDIEETEFSIDSVLSPIKDTMALKAFEKGIELLIDVDKEVPSMIISDPMRLEQIILNLTNNAIKFTENGSVIIKVGVVEDSNDLTVLKFIIKDTGIGIKDKQISNLFKPFIQADSSTTRKYGGTGLGLVVSKNLVEMMGGEIGVNSVYGKGSEFYFTIKVHKSEFSELEKQHKYNAPKSFFNERILVSIENEYAKEILCRYLSEIGNTPKSLSCSSESINEIIDNNYDLIISDCKFKSMSSVDSWQMIRNKLDKDKIPKVIIVTSNGKNDEMGINVLEIVDAVLPKPITKSMLYESLDTLYSDELTDDCSNQKADVSRKISENVFDRIKILLVEDNEINQQVAKEILELKGCNVDVADNGQIALDKLSIDYDYDVILMDLQMPVMDGYEATEKIRENELYNDIPIIALSADAMQGTKEAVLEIGMNDYISKPIDQKILNEKLLNIIGCTKVNEVQPSINAQSLKKEALKSLTCIEVDAALGRINNNIGLYLKLLYKFKERYINFSDSLIELIENKSYDEAKREVHTIKGVSANIGASELNSLVKELELTLKSQNVKSDLINTKIDNIGNKLKEIINEIDMVL